MDSRLECENNGFELENRSRKQGLNRVEGVEGGLEGGETALNHMF